MDLTSIKPGDKLSVTAKLVTTSRGPASWTDHRSQSKLQYEIWTHGNELLLKPVPSQQDLAAAVIQLQRAVELRDKLLDKLYGFDNIPGRPRSGKYAIMEDLGIIRPNLKVHLRELRNKLMHDPDLLQLTKAECDFLADTAWYYLKVTDRIAEQYANEIGYEYSTSETERSSLTLKLEPASWNVEIEAKLAASHVCKPPEADYLNIEVQHCEFVRYGNSLKLHGKISGTPSIIWSIVKDFFEESVL
jgi:hypothetical protein